MDGHLRVLADRRTRETLIAHGFDWTEFDRSVCAALRFKRMHPSAPAVVGLIGGASSGKSTLYNSMVGREVSGISAHAHETLGPIAAMHVGRADELSGLIERDVLLSGFLPHVVGETGPTVGRAGHVSSFRHNRSGLADVMLLDLPDVTSKKSSDEGSITRNLLPWLDTLIVVADEERCFDATVFETTVSISRQLGSSYWVVFNRTQGGGSGHENGVAQLTAMARQRGAVDACVSAFRPGSGYRPLADDVRERVETWLTDMPRRGREASLATLVAERCEALVRINVERRGQFDELSQTIRKEVDSITEEASLSLDLLTPEERRLLGFGHRFVPFYDLYRQTRGRFMKLLGRRSGPAIEFEKRRDRLAEVLKENLEQRFRKATGRIDALIAESPYRGDGASAHGSQWTPPPMDASQWSARIKGHIDAWRSESRSRSRGTDRAALSVGVPLLLADLIFLGGAGLTASWTAAWVSGFFGAKALPTLLRKSPAFEAYRTTVRAYQGLIRESLAEQSEANVAAIPRRHLAMSDPIAGALLACSNSSTWNER